MAIPTSTLLGRRLAYTTGPVLCVLLLAMLSGASGRAALEGRPLAVALGAMHRPSGEQVVWVDTGSQQDADSVALGLAALGRARVQGIVIDVPLRDEGSAADTLLEQRLGALPTILIIGPGSEPAAKVLAHLPPVPFEPPALGGIAAVPVALASASGSLAVEPLGAADADGVWRESALVAGPASAPYPSGALVALSIARGQNPRTLRYLDASQLQVGGRALPVGRGGTIVPFYAPPAGEPGGLRRVTLSELTEPEFDAASLDGRLVVLGHSPELLTALGSRSGTELIAERIEALDSGAYAVRSRWAGTARLLIALLAMALAGVGMPLLTRRFGLLATLGAGLLGAALLLLLELLLLVQANQYLPLLLPAAIGFATTLGAGLTERRRLQSAPAGAAAATIISHAPARRATDLRAVPIAAAAPLRARTAAEFAQRTGSHSQTGSHQRSAGFERSGTLQRTGGTPLRSVAPRPPPTGAADPGKPRTLEEIARALRGVDSLPEGSIADRLLAGNAPPVQPTVAYYSIEREIGHGALSTVYLAHDSRDGRRVALKAIDLADDGDGGAEQRARFFREAETASRLNHPGIVRIHDFGEQGQMAYLAMEFVEGRLLSNYANSAALLPARDVLEIVARIADALDHAHAVGVIHRDIKPANVLYKPATLETKVTDFGIAKLVDQAQTRAGVVLGTPSFMAPEQLEGGTVTGRSDLFALGVTLFQLLTGQLPFTSDSMPGLMERIASAPHPPLSAIRPDLPACVGEVLDRALEKDPGRRYASAGDMAQALRACTDKLLI